MNALSLFGLAIGLAMDAFAAAIGKGLAARSIRLRQCLWVGAWFGGFQAVMPLLGAWIGGAFETALSMLDHWIAFFLLVSIGLSMLRDASNPQQEADASLDPRSMLLVAIATSIDALVAGIPLPLFGVPPWKAALMIGVVAFLLSAVGTFIGRRLGAKYKNAAERLGGIVLIGLGIKILAEHLHML